MLIAWITMGVFVGTVVFWLLLKNRRKVYFIPFAVFVLISLYTLTTIGSIEETPDGDDGFAAVDNQISSQKQMEIGQMDTLTGNLMFRAYDGKINLGTLTSSSTRRDSISILYDFINLETDLTDRSSTWNIIYMDSIDIQAVSSFTLEGLRKDQKVVELVMKAEKLSDNEWLCQEILDIELRNGRTDFWTN